MVKSIDDLKQYLNKVGLMPLFEGNIRGFSVEEITEPSSWWSDDEDADPWIWRMKIAEGHQFAYAKLFDKKWVRSCSKQRNAQARRPHKSLNLL